MKLGCINHALLTAGAIRQSGVRLAAWVANSVEPEMIALEENLQTLHAGLSAPMLGTIPFKGVGCSAEDVVDHLDIELLLEC